MIPVESAHLAAYAISHPGMKGKNNEDRYLVSAFRVSETDATPALLALVADGVGGHRAGEVAAEIAVDVISRVVASSDASQPLPTLRQAFEQANRAIYAHATADSDRSGMGTTCACTWVIGERLYIAWVGDSRIYLLREGQLLQLTVDHTWVQEALENGVLTPEEARNHPNAHMIRRHLGSRQPVDTDFRLRMGAGETAGQAQANQGMLLRPGDQLVLCSDGLTDLVTAAEIRSALDKEGLEPALQYLVDLANRRGGHDNISIVGMRVPQPKAVGRAAWLPRRACTLLAGMILLAAVLAAFLVFYRWWSGGPAVATPTARPTQAPLLLPSIIPTGTPFQPSPGLPATTATVTATAAPLVSATETEAAPETPGAPPATYTPWPTSTSSGP